MMIPIIRLHDPPIHVAVPHPGMSLGKLAVGVVHRHTLLPLHPRFYLLQLTLACKQLLPLFVDLALHLQLDIPQLLLFAA